LYVINNKFVIYNKPAFGDDGVYSAMKQANQEDLLLFKVAEMYYDMEFNLADIAARIGVTSMTVSRLLKKAKEKGIVQINIRAPYETSRQFETRLKNKYGLHNVTVVKSNGVDIEQQVYQAAAILFDLMITGGMTVGIGGGIAISNIVEYMPERVVPELHLIQMVGGFQTTGHRNAYDVLQRLSQKLGAVGCYFPAPIFVRDASMRDSLFQEVYVGSELDKKVQECSLALSGVGPVDGHTIYMMSGLIQPEEMETIKKAGGVGDIYGHFFNERGQLIDHPVHQRLMAVPFEDLKKIKEFILVGGGPERVKGIKAALRIGMVTALVTDYQTAAELL
jgi:lsr operon transcriptional repressor